MKKAVMALVTVQCSSYFSQVPSALEDNLKTSKASIEKYFTRNINATALKIRRKGGSQVFFFLFLCDYNLGSCMFLIRNTLPEVLNRKEKRCSSFLEKHQLPASIFGALK
uniref:Uncharacterized protein n=1 Tax=Glossina pallidipes TaxID=7398 RepID=A0A1A9ZJW5_GLOPL